MITCGQLLRLRDLRAVLFDAIGRALEHDGHCKDYEGTWSIVLPNYFESVDPGTGGDMQYGLRLSCYVVGPERHYHWAGRTFDECLDSAERDVRAWIEEQGVELAQPVERVAASVVLEEVPLPPGIVGVPAPVATAIEGVLPTPAARVHIRDGSETVDVDCSCGCAGIAPIATGEYTCRCGFRVMWKFCVEQR